jgi:saccharopine dehydrogenase (NAD+, L-glutamate forming)
MDKLRWLGLFEDIKIGIPELTPARILQHILEQKWRLRPGDKDMIIMQHQFDYNHLGTNRRIFSNMVVYGEDQNYTAMSISVGLPVAIITKLILEGRIDLTGVHIPVNKLIYEPVLSELKDYGIQFHEKDIKLS